MLKKQLKSFFKSRNFFLLVTTIVGVIVLFLVCTQKICRIITFSDSTGLYFYSALVQANAAILSIVGVFIIFRLQSLQSSIDRAVRALLSDTRTTPSPVIEFEKMNLEEKKTFVERGKIEPPIKPLFREWATNEEKISKIRSSIKLPTRLLAFGIVGDSIGLLGANLIHENGVRIESCVLWLFLLLEVYIVIFVVDGIFNAVDG